MNPIEPIAWWENEYETDVVIAGAGIAGLSFALRLDESIRMVVITKGALGEANTRYAQGGIAAAIGPDDTPELHLEDTLAAGDGLVDIDAARALAERGASAVRWLLNEGVRFDLDGHLLDLGQEAAHSRRRILHAGGDATGAGIEQALVAKLRARPNTTILEHTTAIDLARTEHGDISGIIVLDAHGTSLIAAPVTVLAAGGTGQLWAVTSNPPGATADGISMGLRAGADMADLEFTQFHPTVLNSPGIEPFLISEAVRGEGAYLINGQGDRFMRDIDPRAELAPRNVVASAIQTQIDDPTSGGVFLDLRHLDAAFVRGRFPTIAAYLAGAGLDLATNLIPIAPAAHYFMGGIVAGIDGRTSLPGLLAIGEVSCTGVHGANRLASNSLLEGLVFGINAADTVSGSSFTRTGSVIRRDRPMAEADAIDHAGIRAALRQIMTSNVGVVRTADGLRQAIETIGCMPVPAQDTRASIEFRNMLLAASQIATSALTREESRGGHSRADFPATRPELDGVHQHVQVADGTFVRDFGALHASGVAPRIV
ncbi:MAG TPA: L-aspartate oxidase [Thermomicrobiales bacterium]|nr:L-aspartate oxidase [Thermomicrobiales bacterium]